jgi:Ricin-type beta-trefoil lectin domain
VKTAANRIALGGRRIPPLAFVVLCVAALAFAVLSAPAHASQVNGPAMSSMSTSSSTPISASEAPARSATAPYFVMFKNKLTGYCLSTNWTYITYTVPCDPTADGQWWDIARTTIESYLTDKCLSANWSNEVYTATCGSGAPAHNWTIPWAYDVYYQIKNGLTRRCLSTNLSHAEYTATCDPELDTDGQLWRLGIFWG